MTSNFSGISNNPNIKGLSSAQPYTPVTKHEGTAPAGPTGPDPQLVGWYEQAYAYYNAVMSGDPSTPKPDAQAWNDFLAQMQWAAGQLGYGAPSGQQWNPGMGGPMGPGGPMGQQGPQSNQFGGTTGTMDNWVYTNEKSKIGFTGDGTHDIWSNDVTIDVAPTSANVTVENTTDTRFQPNEPVVKITVTDPATGTQAVYFVHDYDATKDKIKINTPDSASQVVNNTGDTTSITTGHFVAGGAAGGTHADASIEGVPGEGADAGKTVYEPEFAGGTIDFWANPGESQTSVVYSDANISVKPSDTVTVSKPDATTGVITVLVTHRDGTTDTYEVQRGYKVNVNANAEYITFNGQAGTSGVPADMASRVTLNGGTPAEGAAGAPNADAVVSSILEKSGRTEGQLLSALSTAGYTYADLPALKAAITAGQFPPSSPDPKFLDFLRRLDGDLAADCNDLNGLRSSGTDAQKKSKAEGIQGRLIELLGAFYPNAIFTPGAIASGNLGGTVQMNGTNMNWSLTTDGKLDIPGYVQPAMPDLHISIPDYHIELPTF